MHAIDVCILLLGTFAYSSLGVELCDNENMAEFRRCFNGGNFDDLKDVVGKCMGNNNCTEIMGVNIGEMSGLSNFINKTMACSRDGLAKFVLLLNACNQNLSLNLELNSLDVYYFVKHESSNSGVNFDLSSTKDQCLVKTQKCMKRFEVEEKQRFEKCGEQCFDDCSWEETFPIICQCSVDILKAHSSEMLDDFETCMGSDKQSMIKKLRARFEKSLATNSDSFCKKEKGSWAFADRWSSNGKATEAKIGSKAVNQTIKKMKKKTKFDSAKDQFENMIS